MPNTPILVWCLLAHERCRAKARGRVGATANPDQYATSLTDAADLTVTGTELRQGLHAPALRDLFEREATAMFKIGCLMHGE